MADNYVANAGAGGSTFAADDIGPGVLYPRVKLVLGADAAADNDVDAGQQLAAASVPVVLASDHSDIKVTLDSEAVVLGAGTAEIGKLAAGVASIGTVTAAQATAGSLNCTEASAAAIKTAVELIDNAVSGAGFNVTQIGGASAPIGAGLEATAVRVTLPTDGTGVVKLGAGTAAVGKLAANSGVDIGDVDVTSVIPGTEATNLGKAADAVAGATDTGIVPFAVRDDVLAAITPIEGDYAPLRVDANGALWVKHSGVISVDDDAGSLTVDGTVAVSSVTTSVVPGTGATHLGKAIDTAAGATDTGVAALAVRDDALSALTPVEGDFVPLRTDASGALWTHDDALDAALAGSELQVDVVASLPAGDNNIGNVDIVTLPASTNTLEVVGDVAHDAAAAGNPVLTCGVAQSCDDTAPPNRVSAESDAARLATDWDGAIFARPHGPQVWSYHLDTSTAQTDAAVHAAPGAGLSLYVTDIVFSSGAATAINLFFEETATKVLGPYYLEAVAGRGCVLRFLTPKKITANTALTLTTSASIAHCVDVTGYTAQG